MKAIKILLDIILILLFNSPLFFIYEYIMIYEIETSSFISVLLSVSLFLLAIQIGILTAYIGRKFNKWFDSKLK